MIKTILKTLREMEIQFTNIDNLWVAEFEVTKDFNLHLERDTEGRLDIYQRTAGGEYEYIYDIGYLNKRTVYDNDFQALVYPKWIKIKSAVKPLIATITTDGEVNEVVYQAKDIEITSNGTTKVTADTGYTALGSVNVKVNVPTEGGGDKVVYLDITQAVWPMEEFFEVMLTRMSILAVKIPSLEEISTPAGSIYDKDFDRVSALAILSNFRGPVNWETDINTNDVIEQFKQFGAFEITKEEFYNLDNGGNSISFTIDGTSFTAEEGMTWLDFVNSEYSNDDFYVNTDNGNDIVKYQGNRFRSSTNEMQNIESVIIANEAYRTIQEE